MKDDIVYVDSSPLTLQTVLKNNKSIRRCFILSIIVVIVITIIVTVIILKGAQNEFIEQPNTGDASDWDHTTAPSSAPTFISEEVLNAAADVSGWSSVDKLGSPQFRAVGWMSSIDKISIEKFGPWFLQRYSLVVFYFSTGGTFWINQDDWLNPTLHECDWSTVIQCTMNDSEMKVVTGIDATRNGLSGTLPDELKYFTDLEFLHIPKNSVSGDIPNAIGELVKISSLDLSLNKFSGSIPQVIGNAGSIVLLDISHNGITGTIPKDIYKLTLLETLDISWNAFSGPIIDDMENLHKLAVFDIRHNNLYGTLPKALTILTALDYILLDDNAFTGTLPKLSMAMARRLEISLSHNLLTGTLPLKRFERYLQNESPESPFRIKTLDISFNLLTGTVNTIAPLIPSLTYFDLSHNRLQGQFPGDGWSIIEYLAAGNNIFNGTLPVEWPDTLLYLDFGHNFLTKGISDRICQLQDLIFLKLDNNLELNGTVPACIFEIPSLHGLILSNSNLLGFLPTQIGLLSNLETFDGSYNTWIGTLPTELGNCSRLNTFNVSNSRLTGSIPSEIGRLRLLKSLDLRNNRIAGIIPEQLKSLKDLHYLGLAGNGINGSIPPDLCLIERNWSRIDVGCNINCSCCSGDLSLDC